VRGGQALKTPTLHHTCSARTSWHCFPDLKCSTTHWHQYTSLPRTLLVPTSPPRTPCVCVNAREEGRQLDSTWGPSICRTHHVFP
jgi:hypothetical protein